MIKCQFVGLQFMAKRKLKKFAEVSSFDNCFFLSFEQARDGGLPMKGKWHSDYFKNNNPIVLELGCGKGEYTVGLAKRSIPGHCQHTFLILVNYEF